ncbi:hypothetical protein [Bdellovibrio svalbardensis]|uniref:Methyltransferase n=1 Tax=Bdellovibrio svalbardensis TaxID=2972972 RepID=A0ABT6DKV1_9BACT|nr:hypothetical protein [Bdellovibrio svalbardensis]MDG0817142.1 hypothetical protein [Bdellovibrio svalbardensis]
MIFESLEFFLTPTTPLARKYGFLYSSISLKHRYERCKKMWIPHLKNCQDLFTDAVASLPQKKSVVILGSAHLHEIPMHLLLENFEQITLVDVVHPLKHHWLAKRNHRVKLITQDLTEALQHLEKLNSLDELHALGQELAGKDLFHFEADLIVSANLLSQLALLPIDAIEKKLKRELTVDEKDQICTDFAQTHLKNLEGCKGKKLIYADREVIYKDPQGEVIYRGHYPVNFAGYKELKKWNWVLAPLGEASKKYSVEMNIEAYSK